MLDATHNFGCLAIAGLQIIDVVLGDKRRIALSRERYNLLHQRLVSGDFRMVRYFKKDVFGANDIFELRERSRGAVGVARAQKLGDIACK